mmetsp:Transcript_13776/g.37311  ORF Transcript_13776/g.37311 Transcript_13776/m.37311 type:complete len:632 (-) Transcript_13776:8-1903(-)
MSRNSCRRWLCCAWPKRIETGSISSLLRIRTSTTTRRQDPDGRSYVWWSTSSGFTTHMGGRMRAFASSLSNTADLNKETGVVASRARAAAAQRRAPAVVERAPAPSGPSPRSLCLNFWSVRSDSFTKSAAASAKSTTTTSSNNMSSSSSTVMSHNSRNASASSRRGVKRSPARPSAPSHALDNTDAKSMPSGAPLGVATVDSIAIAADGQWYRRSCAITLNTIDVEPASDWSARSQAKCFSVKAAAKPNSGLVPASSPASKSTCSPTSPMLFAPNRRTSAGGGLALAPALPFSSCALLSAGRIWPQTFERMSWGKGTPSRTFNRSSVKSFGASVATAASFEAPRRAVELIVFVNPGSGSAAIDSESPALPPYVAASSFLASAVVTSGVLSSSSHRFLIWVIQSRSSLALLRTTLLRPASSASASSSPLGCNAPPLSAGSLACASVEEGSCVLSKTWQRPRISSINLWSSSSFVCLTILGRYAASASANFATSSAFSGVSNALAASAAFVGYLQVLPTSAVGPVAGYAEARAVPKSAVVSIGVDSNSSQTSRRRRIISAKLPPSLGCAVADASASRKSATSSCIFCCVAAAPSLSTASSGITFTMAAASAPQTRPRPTMAREARTRYARLTT